VHKLQSAPAFQFKGSGWYVTDYAKKDQTAAAKNEGDSKAADKGEKAADGTKSAPTTESSSTSTSSAHSSTPKST
jgi:predicted nucleic acid-binding Zn ribbon protein